MTYPGAITYPVTSANRTSRSGCQCHSEGGYKASLLEIGRQVGR